VSAAEDQAAALRAKHGERWKIWYVPLALGGYTWCARIHGDDLRNVVHADTAEHLDEHIGSARKTWPPMPRSPMRPPVTWTARTEPPKTASAISVDGRRLAAGIRRETNAR